MQPDQITTQALSAALVRLRSSSPFFATLVMFARIEVSELIPTAATDGRNIYLNAQFFQRLKPRQRDGLLVHEVLHAALLHVPRRGTRDPLLWNFAADVVVNGMIRAQQLSLPAGALYDQQLESLRVEEVYE